VSSNPRRQPKEITSRLPDRFGLARVTVWGATPDIAGLRTKVLFDQKQEIVEAEIRPRDNRHAVPARENTRAGHGRGPRLWVVPG
jgi:hypothetical protein